MSRYIYRGSFVQPAGAREYEDGRQNCDAALKKIFARGPQRPDSLQKRAAKAPVIVKANGVAALAEIKKMHRTGRRAGLPEHSAQGDAAFNSKSISAVKKARQVALRVQGHRLPSARELNKRFAERPSVQYHIDGESKVTTSLAGTPSDAWNRMSWRERRALVKGLTTARPRLNDAGVVTDDYNRNGPNSSNAAWNDVHADTGAANDFRDQPAPSQRATVVGAQTVTTPSALTRDAALDAIKYALRKPKAWGNSDRDEDDSLDEDESRAKDANADDAFDTNPNKRKRRADEEE